MLRKRTFASMIALFLMLSMILTLFPLSANNTARAITWFPYIVPAPDPVGLGQRVLVVFGFTMPSRGYGFATYDGWMINITNPDGKVMMLGPYNADSTGSTFTSFVPDQVGEWKLRAQYPGGNVEFNIVGTQRIFMNVPAATTDEYSLTVQQENAPEVSGVPNPTEYWQYPINAENREWAAIGGNWLMPGYDSTRAFDSGATSGSYCPYNSMPNSPHILWTKATLYGGIIGMPYNDDGYYTGSSYRRELQPPIVINGKMYYNQMEPPQQGFFCMDLTTGEIIYHNNSTFSDAKGVITQGLDAQLAQGEILELDTRNWHGGIPYLWSMTGSTWAVWDPWTGDLLYTIVNATSGTRIFDEHGSILQYTLDATANRLILWNSSKMINALVSDTLSNIGRERATYNLNWAAGVQWNVSVPSIPGQAINTWDPKDYSIIIATNRTRGMVLSCTAFEDIAYSGIDGHMLWRKVRNEGTWESSRSPAMSIKDGVYSIERKETRQVYTYSTATGDSVWTSDPRPSQWAMYDTGTCIAYGKLYVISYDGMIYAHNIKTGKVEWKWGPINAGLETPYGVYPLYGGMVVADGKVLVSHGEHSADSPLYRGEGMYAVDANNGTTVWSIDGWYQQPVVACGIIVAPNNYDGKDYCFGKGPSATTISVSPDVSVFGNSVLIKGSATDISVGTKQNEIACRFPNGVPAVSDASMSDWMAYVYMQKQKPTNTTGVTVSLDVIDSNNNFRNIGTATTDSSGAFSYVWKPDIPGKYTIIASFAGSEAYWGSSGETAFEITSATAATGTPIALPVSVSETYFMPAVIAITVALIIILILLALILLRKRP